MAGASAEGEVNHWPGLVDTLTTIIMVVTFLLIILAATVFSLSKKIVEQVHAEKVVDANTDDFLRQDERVKGDARLSIRTRASDNTKTMRVAAEEAPEATADIKTFLDARGPLLKSAKLEIWSFAPGTNSVSEAQRIAYYRALKMRNILIDKGVSAARISAQVRVDDQVNRGHTVKVALKP